MRWGSTEPSYKFIVQFIKKLTLNFPFYIYRLVQLLNDLKNEHGNIKKTLIFGATKRRCEKINSYLNRVGFRSVVMHGDKSQQERETALKRFRNDYSPILVATDVCARGLDVDGIDTVINYDFCQSIEDYVHRIGRTGRSNNLGQSFTFFTEGDARLAKDLVNILQEAKQEIDPELLNLARSSSKFGNSRGGNFRKYGTMKKGSFGGGGFSGRNFSGKNPQKFHSRQNENGNSGKHKFFD